MTVAVALPRSTTAAISAASDEVGKFFLRQGLDRGADVLPQPIFDRVVAGFTRQ
jgi:hypothetical protein